MKWSFIFMIWGLSAAAQIYGPQAEEFAFKIETKVYSKTKNIDENLLLAEQQISHLFGLFQTPKVVRDYRLLHSLVGGIGAPLYPMTHTIKNTQKQKNGSHLISFQTTGRILLHKSAAKQILSGRKLKIPMPVHLENYYDVKCTDEHYDSITDFWYFYDPYRDGCEYLGRPPLAETATLEITHSQKRKLDLNLRLDLLRGNNANGEKLRIDIIQGFSDSAQDPEDIGRQNFEGLQEYLTAQGYERKLLQAHPSRTQLRFTKSMDLNNNPTKVEINTLLVDSNIDSKGVTFAKFFKAAVEESDVVYYTGHSGLGGTLDIALLEEKAGGFKFHSQKRQIFYFDSCSSYSYYLWPFRAEKTRARLDIVTNGLSAYFDTGLGGLTTFLEHVLDPDVEDHTWPEVLTAIEDQMDGHTYLVNVGGI